MDLNYYKSQLINHYKNPKGQGSFSECHRIARGVNPLCGDEIKVGVMIEDSRIIDIKFSARACSICIASSSIMVETLQNQNVSVVPSYLQAVNQLLKGEQVEGITGAVSEPLGAISTVSPNLSRHKCVCIGWEALSEALK